MALRPIIYNVDLDFRRAQLAPIGDVDALTFHHTVTAAPRHKAHALMLMRQMHGWHLDKGWAGLGYHWGIDRLGRLYRGRPTRYSGSHVGYHNHGNIGVCVFGDYSPGKHKLNAAQRNAMRWLVEHYKRHADIHVLGGHREWDGHESNACPGTMLTFVRWIRGKYSLRRP